MNKLNHVNRLIDFEIDNSFDSDRFIKLRARIVNEGFNPNKTRFSRESIDDAESTLKNIPILAHVIDHEEKVKDFGSHDSMIVENQLKEGEYKEIYLERPIGLIPETNNYSIEEYEGKNYVYSDVYIWKGYSNYAEDIIQRDSDIKLSMEVIPLEVEYLQDVNAYDIKKYKYAGVTFLGSDLETGIEDAIATKVEFSKQRDDFVKLASELKFELDKLNNESTQEIGDDNSIEDNLNIKDNYNGGVDVGKEKISFSTTYRQKREALVNALDPKIIKDDKGEIIEETYFYVSDFDDTYVFVERNHWLKNDYTCEYGRFSYTFDEENITANITSDFEKMYRMWLTKKEKDTLDLMRSNYEKLKNDYEVLEQESKELKEFKKNIETEKDLAEKELEFEKFKTSLSEEDMKPIREKINDYSKDEIYKELCVIYAMKDIEAKNNAIKYSKNNEAPVSENFSKQDTQEKEVQKNKFAL